METSARRFSPRKQDARQPKSVKRMWLITFAYFTKNDPQTPKIHNTLATSVEKWIEDRPISSYDDPNPRRYVLMGAVQINVNEEIERWVARGLDAF